jgi:hypothetical protein
LVSGLPLADQFTIGISVVADEPGDIYEEAVVADSKCCPRVLFEEMKRPEEDFLQIIIAVSWQRHKPGT